MSAEPEITSAGARRIYRILVYLVDSEEAPDPREREVLAVFRERHGLSDAEAAAIEAEKAETARLSLSMSDDERACLIDALIDVVAADRCLDQQEQRRLTRLADFLGLPRAELASRLLERLSGGP